MADQSVDIVICDYVLEHVEHPDQFQEEIDRILKPGGCICARTPHKYCYIAILARLVKNAAHSKVLKYVQPDRKEIDVFPTFYRLNTLSAIKAKFASYGNQTFIFRSDPSYYFGKKAIHDLLDFAHRILPKVVSGNLFVFLQKP